MAVKAAVLIPAAGASSRFKGKKKKQFSDIDGRAVFLRAIEVFADRDDVAQIVMAIPAEDRELFEIKWGDSVGFHGVRVIDGGSERYATAEKLLAEVADDVDLVAIHDAVRPCITKEKIDAVFAAAAQTGAAILANRIPGTVKKSDDQLNIVETPDRTDLWEAQTPQVFRLDILKEAYKRRASLSQEITDDAQLVSACGVGVRLVESDSSNIKITCGVDLVIASAILKSRPKPKPTGPAGPWAAEQGW